MTTTQGGMTKHGGVTAFLAWETATRDSMDVKRCYIDMAGDHAAGALLSQIVYLFLPDRSGQPKSQLVEFGGERWVAIPREGWWQECRLTTSRFDRCRSKLARLGLIVVEVHRLGGVTCPHIRINWPVFLARHREVLGKDRAETPRRTDADNAPPIQDRTEAQNPDPYQDTRNAETLPSCAQVADFRYCVAEAEAQAPPPDECPPEPAVSSDCENRFSQNAETGFRKTLKPKTLKTLKRDSEQTLNVSGAVNFVACEERSGPLWDKARRIVEELRDWGSERRHAQLLGICERNGLDHLPDEALHQTRRRQAQEGRLGPLEKPARYYDRTLVRLLAAKEIHVGVLADAREQGAAMRVELGLPLTATEEQVRAAIRASMG